MNFTYQYYLELLKKICNTYSSCLIRNASPTDNVGKVFLRHDVDFSLELAICMAELEESIGVKSSYFVMVDSLMYSPNREKIMKFLEMGHEVGLHATRLKLKDIEQDRKILSAIISDYVSSVSFHCPLRECLRGPFLYSGMVNAYSYKLMQGYVSDSRGEWSKDPLEQLQKPHLQILTHPIWWGSNFQSPEVRLENFFQTKIRTLDYDMDNYISVRRGK